MTLKELKEIIDKDWKENPQLYDILYKDEDWIHDIIATLPSLDDRDVYAEWTPVGVSNEGRVWYRLSNFAFIE